MNRKRRLLVETFRYALLAVCTISLLPGGTLAYVQTPTNEQVSSTEGQAPKIPPEQLDSFVAPIALYPDPLLAQTLAASTYPLEIVQLQQWLAQHKDLKDQALADAVQKQDWDPSIQGLAGLPDVVKRLADDIKWTTDLGNAFLAQQSDVMDAVQRMRAKAQVQGNLKSTEQMKVETQTVESKQVIVIEQANPQVVYVPSYNPTNVYGPPAYPYPAVAYPPPGYYAAGMALSFGVGVAMGAMWHGGWGYNCGWHGGYNNININNNNNYVRNSNVNTNRTANQAVRGNSGTWQHNPQHRGGTPYSNTATANRFGGTATGSSISERQANTRQNIGQERVTGEQFGGASRGGTEGADRLGQGGDRISNRSVSSGGGESRGGGFGNAGFSGNNSRASSSRGASSMGSGFRGGGRRR